MVSSVSNTVGRLAGQVQSDQDLYVQHTVVLVSMVYDKSRGTSSTPMHPHTTVLHRKNMHKARAGVLLALGLLPLIVLLFGGRGELGQGHGRVNLDRLKVEPPQFVKVGKINGVGAVAKVDTQYLGLRQRTKLTKIARVKREKANDGRRHVR